MDDLFIDDNDLANAKNPLQTVFYASLILVLWDLYILFTGGGVLARMHGSAVAYTQLGINISIMLVFILFYLKRSIFAWWTPLFSMPILWIAYFIFEPFSAKRIATTLFFQAIVTFYLVSRYKLYKSYIKCDEKNN